MKKFAFTLAELLITLGIIGVVAALTIPSFISTYDKQVYKTGLKKALNALNNSIAASVALEEETLLTNKDVFNYLQRHMLVMKSTSLLPFVDSSPASWGGGNAAFYTTDGMRFELWSGQGANFRYFHEKKLHEGDVCACNASLNTGICGGCGSYGLEQNPLHSKKAPCYILVDVNGDKKPTPSAQRGSVKYDYKPDGDMQTDIVGDIFLIMLTETRAIPFGTIAQRTMYDFKSFR